MTIRMTILSMLIVALMPNSVFAHWNPAGVDAVDGSEIRYEDHTQYDDARTWAINRWNALGTIDILPDAWNTNNDLDIEDKDACSANWVGQYLYYGQTGIEDRLQFNSCFMWGCDTSEKRYVALYEFGHALGLGHSYSPNVMASGRYSNTSLGSHEIFSYDHLWNNPSNWCGDPH